MAARNRIITAAAATLGLAMCAGLVLAQDVSGLLNQRKLDSIRAQQTHAVMPAPVVHAPVERSAAPQVSALPQGAPQGSPPPADSQALANGLIAPGQIDPNAQPYIPSAGPAVLPPIRPSDAQLRERVERERARAERARQEAAARAAAPAPQFRPAPQVQQRSGRICPAGRCPAENMIGIQY